MSCSRFIVYGTNLGALDGASQPPGADLAAINRASLALQGFDFVQYAIPAYQSVTTSPACLALMQNSTLLPSSCATHTAVNCTYLIPHVAIICELDSGGWGQGFNVRVVVKGQASQWSTDSIAYPPPLITRTDIVWVSGASKIAVGSRGPLANGGSLLRLQGQGLSPLSQVVVTFGGVPVAPFGESGVGGFANTLSTLPPLVRPDGSLPYPAELRYSPLQSILFCVPPGLGTVDIIVWVGDRVSSPYNITYEPPSMLSFTDVDLKSIAFTGATLTGNASNIPACALCFSSLKSTTSLCGPRANCSDSSSPVCYFPPPPPQPPITPYTCPVLDALVDSTLKISTCALPSSLWAFSPTTSLPPTTTTFCPFPGGIAASAGGVRTRCLNNSSSSLFSATLGITQGSPGVATLFEPNLFFPVTLFQSSLNPSGDLLRVKVPVDLGPVALVISQADTTTTTTQPLIVSSAFYFNKYNLLGNLPLINSLSLESGEDYLEPRGGDTVLLNVSNGGDFGFLMVSPAGLPPLPGQTSTSQRISYPSPLCSTQALVPPWVGSNVHTAAGWKAGPFFCPVTLASDLSLPSDPTVFCCSSADLRGYLGCSDTKCNLQPRLLRLLLRGGFFSDPDPLCSAPTSSDSTYATWDLTPQSQSKAAALCWVNRLSSKDRTFLARVAYEPCSPSHWIEKPALPCSVAKWNKYFIAFFAPPWQGTAYLSLNVNGQFSENEKELAYFAPLVTGITPNANVPTPGGATVAVTGRHFGGHPSLGALWTASGAQYLGYRESINASTLGPNSIVLYYQGVSSSQQFPARICALVSWSDTKITCIVPEGVPFSPNQVVVVHSTSVPPLPLAQSLESKQGWATSSVPKPSSNNTFTYARGEILGLLSPNRSTDGGYMVSLVGQNLGRFLGNSSALDCSNGGLWSVVANVKSQVQTLTGVGTVSTLLPTSTILHSNGMVNFTMPPFEGDFSVALEYTSLQTSQPTLCSSIWASTADPPMVLLPQAFSVDTNGVDDVDPCRDILTYSNASSSQCLRDAWEVKPWAGGGGDQQASPTQTCFRGSLSGTGAQTMLRFSGRNFGYGAMGDTSNITVVSLAHPEIKGVRCLPKTKPTVLVSETVLECALEKNVPYGPALAIITIAFKTTTVPLLSVCACGSFSDRVAGPYCVPCPPGGSCRGGSDRPRAIAGAWETKPEEWAGRFVTANISTGFPRFVPCAQQLRCLANNTCKEPRTANTSWMCTTCPPNAEPGDDLTCEMCTAQERTATYLSMAVSLGGIGLVLGLLYLGKVYIYDRGCYGWVEKAKEGGKEGEDKEDAEGRGGGDGGEGKDAAGKSTAPNNNLVPAHRKFVSAPLGSYVKVMLTYTQTLGALAAYTKAMIPQNLKGNTNQVPISQLLPVYLGQLSVVMDVGFSSHSIRCLLNEFLPTFTARTQAVMMVPFLSAVATFFFYFLYTLGGRVVVAVGAWRKGKGGGQRNLLTSAARSRRSCYATFIQWSTDERLTVGYLALLFILSTLPMTIRALAALQDCAPETSGLYLRAEPSISCNDEKFSNGLQTYALGMGWLYLAFPAVVGMVLYGVFGKVNLGYFTFLLEGYKLNEPLARAWECLVTVRKSLFVGLSASFVPRITDPRIQLVVTMFIITAFLGVQEHYRPLKFDRLNDLDGYALASQLAFCFSVMIRQQGSSGEQVFLPRTVGSYVYYIISDGSSASSASTAVTSGTTLGGVPYFEQAAFDLVAAYFAARFIILWVFYLLDDKLGKGGWGVALAARAKMLGETLDSWFAGLWLALLCSTRKAGPALSNSNVLFLKRISHEKGWRHLKNPDGRSMFYPPEAGMYDNEADVRAKEFPEGDSQWTLPITGLTLSGWQVHMNQLTGKGTTQWESMESGEVVDTTPPMDFPGAEDVTEGEWVLYWKLEDNVAPIWLNARTEEVELDLNAFPDKAVTKNGWTFTPDPDGRLFWLNLRTLEALWDLPQEEYTKAVWEVAHTYTPPLPLPSTWMPIWDSATERPLYWLNVELLECEEREKGGNFILQNTPSGVVLGVELEPPIDPGTAFPPFFPTATSLVLNGGWRWKECPLSQRGFSMAQERWPEEEAGPPPATLASLALSLPPSLMSIPPQFNVWFQCNYWEGPGFWVNLATGASLEGELPFGASSLSGWKCEEEEDGSGVKYVNESTGAVQRATPQLESTEDFLWLSHPRDPWEWCKDVDAAAIGKEEGVWRRKHRGSGTLPSSYDSVCTHSGDIPVGHSTLGGWRHIQHPMLPSLTLWIHPLLKSVRKSSSPPSPFDEAAGSSAPAPNDTDIWRKCAVATSATSTSPLSPSSHYRRLPLLPVYWKQDGTGALALSLPLNANLAAGWVHAEFHSASSSFSGNGSGSGGVGQYFNTLTGASTHTDPAVCLASYATTPPWRYSQALGQWWQEGGMGEAGRTDTITEACPLPGGWAFAPTLLGNSSGSSEDEPTLCYVHVGRREVKPWEDPPLEVLVEPKVGDLGSAPPMGATHHTWRLCAKGGGLKVWVEDVTGAVRPFEPPDHANLGGGWQFIAARGAFQNAFTQEVKYGWSVEDSEVVGGKEGGGFERAEHHLFAQ